MLCLPPRAPLWVVSLGLFSSASRRTRRAASQQSPSLPRPAQPPTRRPTLRSVEADLVLSLTKPPVVPGAAGTGSWCISDDRNRPVWLVFSWLLPLSQLTGSTVDEIVAARRNLVYHEIIHGAHTRHAPRATRHSPHDRHTRPIHTAFAPQRSCLAACRPRLRELDVQQCGQLGRLAQGTGVTTVATVTTVTTVTTVATATTATAPTAPTTGTTATDSSREAPPDTTVTTVSTAMRPSRDRGSFSSAPSSITTAREMRSGTSSGGAPMKPPRTFSAARRTRRGWACR